MTEVRPPVRRRVLMSVFAPEVNDIRPGDRLVVLDRTVTGGTFGVYSVEMTVELVEPPRSEDEVLP